MEIEAKMKMDLPQFFSKNKVNKILFGKFRVLTSLIACSLTEGGSEVSSPTGFLQDVRWEILIIADDGDRSQLD